MANPGSELVPGLARISGIITGSTLSLGRTDLGAPILGHPRSQEGHSWDTHLSGPERYRRPASGMHHLIRPLTVRAAQTGPNRGSQGSPKGHLYLAGITYIPRGQPPNGLPQDRYIGHYSGPTNVTIEASLGNPIWPALSGTTDQPRGNPANGPQDRPQIWAGLAIPGSPLERPGQVVVPDLGSLVAQNGVPAGEPWERGLGRIQLGAVGFLARPLRRPPNMGPDLEGLFTDMAQI